MYACPLANCTNPVPDPRQPCDECAALFGQYLQPSSRPASVGEFTRARDEGDARVAAVLAERRAWTSEAAA